MPGDHQITKLFERALARLGAQGVVGRGLVVEAIQSHDRAFAGVNSEGAQVLAIETELSSKRVVPVVLHNLVVEYGVSYTLQEAVSSRRLRVSVLRCTADDPEVRGLFATFCQAVLDSLPPRPSELALQEQIEGWVELFWNLQLPIRTSLVGLIGEITLLDSVARPDAWIRAWHASPNDNIDYSFSHPLRGVEVKATTGTERVHEISIHQTTPLADEVRLFASVLVELRDSGTPLGEVLDQIEGRVRGPSELALFRRVLLETCGSSYPEYRRARYMRELSLASLAFFEVSSVPQPKVALPLPAGVSNLRFRSDFSSTKPLDRRLVLEGVTEHIPDQVVAPAHTNE